MKEISSKKIDELLKPALEDFVSRAREAAFEFLSADAFFGKTSDLWCESEIEWMFLFAWKSRRYFDGRYGADVGGDAVGFTEAQDACGPQRLEEIKGIRHGVIPWWINEDIRQIDLIVPQFKVEQYRADFLVTKAQWNCMSKSWQVGPLVLVECDGHDYHDRTKEQAARDKSRDRELQAHGYHVHRFTGSEIFRNAPLCAEQVDDFFSEHFGREELDRRKAAALKEDARTPSPT